MEEKVYSNDEFMKALELRVKSENSMPDCADCIGTIITLDTDEDKLRLVNEIINAYVNIEGFKQRRVGFTMAYDVYYTIDASRVPVKLQKALIKRANKLIFAYNKKERREIRQDDKENGIDKLARYLEK